MNAVVRWLTAWRQKRAPVASPYPLGLIEQDIEALRALRESPHWKRYIGVLERLGEQQAATLSSGLDHNKYLFACGALTAIRRVYSLVDDLLAGATQIKELQNDRTKREHVAARRVANTFVNTPFYDGFAAEQSR